MASTLTADGTNTGAFRQTDWALLASVSCIWGSSFLWIAIGLDSLHPGAIALIRVVLGAAVLATVPAAKRVIRRESWPALAVVALLGNSAPALLFPFAQQRVESSVAGMVNAASPLMVLLIAVLMTRRAPRRGQVVGLLIGFVGAALLFIPNLSGADAEPLGMLLIVAAVVCYATSNNFLPPLQQEYGGPAVVAWALMISSVVLAPYGVWGLTRSSFEWGPVVAVTILGVVGTGTARSLFATFVGRVGAPRSSMVGYFVPIVAIALGVLVRDESVGPIEILGTVIVLAGAYLISRPDRPKPLGAGPSRAGRLGERDEPTIE